MRIAFFADNFYPELSGIVDSILITGRELTKRGHEVAYVGPRYAPSDYEKVFRKALTVSHDRFGDIEHFEGMPIVRLPAVRLPNSPTGQSRIAFPTGASFSFLEKFKPDILHTHSPYGCGFEALRASKKFGVPLVGTNHTPIEEFFPAGKELMRSFDAWYYNHCQYITTPYAALIARMRQKGYRKEGGPMPNPFESDLFHAPSPEEKTRIKHEMNLSGPVILYCGRLAPEKKVDQIIAAVARLVAQFPSLTLIATGHGAARPALEAQAQKLGIGGNVRFTGFLKLEELPAYYHAADIFCIMSTADSQSLALMQGFASALPAVGARSRGLPDYIRPECGFLVEPGDIEALSAQLHTLITDTALRERMGRAGAQFVEQFSPAAIAARWEDIYASHVGGASAQEREDSSSFFSSRRSRERMNRVNK